MPSEACPCHFFHCGGNRSCGWGLRSAHPGALYHLFDMAMGLLAEVSVSYPPNKSGQEQPVTMSQRPLHFRLSYRLVLRLARSFQTFTKLPLAHVDYVGTVLTMAGTVLLVFIINQIAVRAYAWNSAQTITVLVLSGVCWVALFPWQRHLDRSASLQHIKSPFPYRIMTSRVMMCSIWCVPPYHSKSPTCTSGRLTENTAVHSSRAL